MATKARLFDTLRLLQGHHLTNCSGSCAVEGSDHDEIMKQVAQALADHMKRRKRERESRAKEPKGDKGWTAFKDWAFKLWPGSSQWAKTEWVALYRGYRSFVDADRTKGDERARVSWISFLRNEEDFYKGHYPRKWAAEPERFLPAAVSPAASFGAEPEREETPAEAAHLEAIREWERLNMEFSVSKPGAIVKAGPRSLYAMNQAGGSSIFFVTDEKAKVQRRADFIFAYRNYDGS